MKQLAVAWNKWKIGMNGRSCVETARPISRLIENRNWFRNDLSNNEILRWRHFEVFRKLLEIPPFSNMSFNAKSTTMEETKVNRATLRFLISADCAIPGRKRAARTRRGDPSMSLPFKNLNCYLNSDGKMIKIMHQKTESNDGFKMSCILTYKL